MKYESSANQNKLRDTTSTRGLTSTAICWYRVGLVGEHVR